MKKNIKYIVCISAVIMLASCGNKEPLGYAPVNTDNFFYAKIAEAKETKTNLDGLKIIWNEADQVMIDGALYAAEVDKSNPTCATFRPADESSHADVTFHTGIFPSSLYKGSEDVDYNLPSEFEYNNERYDIPMYAEGNTQNLIFHSIFATIKVCLPDDVVVKSLSVSSDLFLNGDFNVDNSNLSDVHYVSAEIINGANQNKTTTISFNPSVSGADVYFPIPANRYSGKNLKFTITTEDGVKQEMSTNQNAQISILAGMLYTFNFRRDGLFDSIGSVTIGYNDIL